MNFLGQFLVSSLTTGGTVLVLARFWLKERIRVGVEEESAKRVKAFQHEADRGLEEYKASLVGIIEALRSDLSKSGTDYAIYVQKKHVAIAAIYSELIEAEYLVGGSIKKPYWGRSDRSESAKLAGEAVNRAREAYFANALYLTAGLDEKAWDICNLIDEIAQERLFPDDNSASTRNGKLRELRQSLHSFMSSAREELAQGRPVQTSQLS
jgi:hypothetical protein